MRQIQKLSVLALALAVLTSGALFAATADTSKGTGIVTGKVVDKEGKAVNSAAVIAMLPPAKGEKHAKKEAGDSKDAKEKRKEALNDRILVQTTTAADGTFTLQAVPTGNILIVARKQGTGNAHSMIEVKAGETTPLSGPLTLAKPVEGEHKGEHKKDKN